MQFAHIRIPNSLIPENWASHPSRCPLDRLSRSLHVRSSPAHPSKLQLPAILAGPAAEDHINGYQTKKKPPARKSAIYRLSRGSTSGEENANNGIPRADHDVGADARSWVSNAGAYGVRERGAAIGRMRAASLPFSLSRRCRHGACGEFVARPGRAGEMRRGGLRQAGRGAGRGKTRRGSGGEPRPPFPCFASSPQLLQGAPGQALRAEGKAWW